MQEKNEPDTESIGFKLGYLTGVVIYACVIAAIVALTIRFILWLF